MSNKTKQGNMMSKSAEAILKISNEDKVLQASYNTLKAIPEKRKKLRFIMKKGENDVKILEREKEKISNQIQEREHLIKVESEKTKKADDRMLQVKNQKEYIACQKEKDTVKKTIKIVEDQILELEESKESTDKELSQIIEQYRQKKELVYQEEQNLQENENVILEQIETYKKLKEEIALEAEAELFAEYSELTRRNIIPAAVEVTSNCCSGCAISFPAQLFNDIIRCLSGKCPHCGRILFYKAPEKPKEEPKPKKTKAKRKTAKKAN